MLTVAIVQLPCCVNQVNIAQGKEVGRRMETFSVSLDTDDPAVRFIIETAPIAITDNDGKCNHILLCSAMTAIL